MFNFSLNEYANVVIRTIKCLSYLMCGNLNKVISVCCENNLEEAQSE